MNRKDAITTLAKRGYPGNVPEAAVVMAEAAADGLCLLAKHMVQCKDGEFEVMPVPWEGDGHQPVLDVHPEDRDLAWLQQVIEVVDAHLDAAAPEVFRLGTPASEIASMHRRVDKAASEAHEAMEELSLLTGENPRKPADPAARGRMLAELGDTAMAALLGIQSQVKDIKLTWVIFTEMAAKAYSRVPDEHRPPRYPGLPPADQIGPGMSGLTSDEAGRRLP